MKKRTGTLLSALAALLLLPCPAAGTTGPAADVVPLPQETELNLEDGWYCARLEDADRADEGWFTLALYRTDEYDAEQVRSLRAGDTVLVNGEVYTVTGISARDIGWFGEEDVVWELETEEECWGGLYFRDYGEGTFAAYLDDWNPCTYAGSVKVTLPLDEGFELVRYPGGEEPEYDGPEAFPEHLREDDWSIYNEYNTTAAFSGGRLVRITRSGYPHGPSSGEEGEDDC